MVAHQGFDSCFQIAQSSGHLHHNSFLTLIRREMGLESQIFRIRMQVQVVDQKVCPNNYRPCSISTDFKGMQKVRQVSLEPPGSGFKSEKFSRIRRHY